MTSGSNENTFRHKIFHPLGALTDAQFMDGVSQVVTLADNYGTSYSSSNLVFQGGQN